MLKRFSNEVGLLIIAALFFCLQGLALKPILAPRTLYLVPPLELKHLVAGFNAQVADSFWLRSIQDMEYCEAEIDGKVCKNKSWLFNVINLTVELDPSFSEAFYFGALALTVLVEDREGASIIYDKATALYKYDWHILYAAAYHALFEEKNQLKAGRLYLQAANMGAPSWVRLSAGKLIASGGDKKAAEEILEQMIMTEQHPLWIKQLRSKLEESKSSQ